MINYTDQLTLLMRDIVARVEAILAKHQLKAMAIVITHAHVDHVAGAARAKEAFDLARQRNSLEGLAEIRDKLLATSYGAPSLITLGMGALDRGHYLEALDFQKEIVKIQTIFGGKNPHPNWLVGGVPCPINVHDTGAVRRRHRVGQDGAEREQSFAALFDRRVPGKAEVRLVAARLLERPLTLPDRRRERPLVPCGRIFPSAAGSGARRLCAGANACRWCAGRRPACDTGRHCACLSPDLWKRPWAG